MLGMLDLRGWGEGKAAMNAVLRAFYFG
jgi:hypothetical protein